MSIRNTVLALPTLVKVSVIESIAYRAEILIWILTTTMPFIMLALWHAVATEAPLGRMAPHDFTAYFLSMFVVRMLTSSWLAWELNFQVRQGTLSYRLLRPVQALWHMSIENLSALPLRVIVLMPVIILGAAGRSPMWPQTPEMWSAWILAVIGGWAITCLVNVVIGTLSLTSESSIKVMEFWLALYFVLSGYTIPLKLFPAAWRNGIDLLPFRYQVGLAVEVMTGAHKPHVVWRLLQTQWIYVAALWLLASWMWRRGLRHYGAFGG